MCWVNELTNTSPNKTSTWLFPQCGVLPAPLPPVKVLSTSSRPAQFPSISFFVSWFFNYRWLLSHGTYLSLPPALRGSQGLLCNAIIYVHINHTPYRPPEQLILPFTDLFFVTWFVFYLLRQIINLFPVGRDHICLIYLLSPSYWNQGLTWVSVQMFVDGTNTSTNGHILALLLNCGYALVIYPLLKWTKT